MINQWFQCVVAPVLFFVVLGAFAVLMLNRARGAELPEDIDTRPKVIAVFTMDDCPPCNALKQRMAHWHWKLKVTECKDQPAVEQFPTVFYEVKDEKNRTTLIFDNGQNIHKGNVRPPEAPVTVVHWRTK